VTTAAPPRTGELRVAITEALREEMARDERVILMGEDLAGGAGVEGHERKDAWGGVAGVTRGLVAEFGRDRVLDTPISEAAFMGAAVGSALTGLRPIPELQFIDFLGVCLDQVFNQGAKIRYMHGGGDIEVPMVIRCMIGAGVRAGAHQSQSCYSTFAHFPGIKVVVPATPADAKGLMVAAIRDPNPVVYCEHSLLYAVTGDIPEGDHVVELGRADVKREGADVTVVASGLMVHRALEAAEALDDVDVEVVDLRTVAPLDEETILESVRKTGRLVVVDEDTPWCSVAGDVVALAAREAFDSLKAAPRMVTAPHAPVPFSPPLEDAYIPSAGAVADAVRAVVGARSAAQV
jgi:pyruvate/2-oxoglutarate/acetoin dehydrogenase E1 component